MARIAGELWRYNVARVTVVDVTDDYRSMLDPMPSVFYPVLAEMWLPRHRLLERLAGERLMAGYFYEWHDGPHAFGPEEHLYVGVVSESLV